MRERRVRTGGSISSGCDDWACSLRRRGSSARDFMEPWGSQSVMGAIWVRLIRSI